METVGGGTWKRIHAKLSRTARTSVPKSKKYPQSSWKWAAVIKSLLEMRFTGNVFHWTIAAGSLSCFPLHPHWGLWKAQPTSLGAKGFRRCSEGKCYPWSFPTNPRPRHCTSNPSHSTFPTQRPIDNVLKMPTRIPESEYIRAVIVVPYIHRQAAGSSFVVCENILPILTRCELWECTGKNKRMNPGWDRQHCTRIFLLCWDVIVLVVSIFEGTAPFVIG